MRFHQRHHQGVPVKVSSELTSSDWLMTDDVYFFEQSRTEGEGFFSGLVMVWWFGSDYKINIVFCLPGGLIIQLLFKHT